jgi:hypothetical protein
MIDAAIKSYSKNNKNNTILKMRYTFGTRKGKYRKIEPRKWIEQDKFECHDLSVNAPRHYIMHRVDDVKFFGVGGHDANEGDAEEEEEDDHEQQPN